MSPAGALSAFIGSWRVSIKGDYGSYWLPIGLILFGFGFIVLTAIDDDPVFGKKFGYMFAVAFLLVGINGVRLVSAGNGEKFLCNVSVLEDLRPTGLFGDAPKCRK
jgi:hypothetical protein